MAINNYLRLQNIMNNDPSNYGINNPFQSPPDTTFINPPMDPTMNAQMPNPPQIQTQDSVLANQSKGGDHPAASENWLRLKSIMDSFQPETQATDRFNNLLDNTPQINTPGIGRKIVAAGQALGNIGPHFTRTGGGPDAADRVLYAPYLQDMAAFKEKAGPFQQAAQLENTANVNERTLTGNLLTAASNADKVAQASEDSDKKNAIAQQKADNTKAIADERNRIEQQRINILQAKQQGATVHVINGHAVATWADGTSMDLGNYENTTALAVQDKKNEGNLAVTVQQGKNQMGVQGAITSRGESKPVKPLTPAATARDRINKAQEILNWDPTLAPYITIQGTDVHFNDPGGPGLFSSGPDPKLVQRYNDAKSKVYPEGNPNFNFLKPFSPNNTGNQPVNTTNYTYQKDPNNPNERRRISADGKVTEYSHDGGMTWGVK